MKLDNKVNENARRRRPETRRMTVFLCAVASAFAVLPTASATARQLCDAAAQTAAAQTGVPLRVLAAITRSETGRATGGSLRPWPWTVNMEGLGKWFDTRDDALAYVTDKFGAGARSFDVGCFQINYKWHGSHFASISEMFDPDANALYAAGFLKDLYAETGDWSAAAGAYHSRTEKYAKLYRKRFDRIFGRLADHTPRIAARNSGRQQGEPAVGRQVAHVERQNSYPLLRATGGTPHLGSLVSLAGSDSGRGSLLASANGGLLQ